jgi:hypothetical protein
LIYQITDAGVRTGKNFKEFNNKYHVLLEESECVPCGGDFVVNCTGRDLDFLQDKARVSNIMFGNFFRKDNSAKVFGVVNIILTFLVLVLK